MVVDMSGRKVKTVKAQSGINTINIQELPTGTYFITITANNHKLQGKFQKT
jgi:hypothetical protein